MVKIDIISGFLGAGKTTFANKLLKYYLDSGLRAVFVVNEFGKTALDADITRANGFTAVEITNGCVCCTLKADVPDAINEVVARFHPDRIVFEPSGIFIFDDFVEMIKTSSIKEHCELDAVMTVVDGVNFSLSKASYGNFVYNQIRNAPMLVISKLDKPGVNAETIICDLRLINPEAAIIAKRWDEFGPADFEKILATKPYDGTVQYAHGHAALDSFTFVPPEEMTRAKAGEFAALCAGGGFGNLARAKGIVTVDGRPSLINIAQSDIEIVDFNGKQPPTFTFIGSKVDREKILNFFFGEPVQVKRGFFHRKSG